MLLFIFLFIIINFFFTNVICYGYCYCCCCFAACGRVRVSVSLFTSNVVIHSGEPAEQNAAAGHRNVPPKANPRIHVQKLFLGPQTRAMVDRLKSARCLELSPMKSGTAFGALAGLSAPLRWPQPFMTPAGVKLAAWWRDLQLFFLLCL